MVSAKPMQLTMVSAEPLKDSGACRATSVENCGESPTTLKPQRPKNITKTRKLPCKKITGDSKQHIPEVSSIPQATCLLPLFKDQ